MIVRVRGEKDYFEYNYLIYEQLTELEKDNEYDKCYDDYEIYY